MRSKRSSNHRLFGPLLFALLFVSALASLAAMAALMATPPAPTSVSIELADMVFRPATVEIPANRPVSLELHNTGGLEHDWSVDELAFSPNVRPGQSLVVELSAPTGVYQVYCSLPGHREAGMVGQLEVR
ncbi:MAG: cupredoxin domain-containing protein [Chloroflexia bacterium]|nr:cupredoxin domain-containing protein [Chloroflexia bacterium]